MSSLSLVIADSHAFFRQSLGRMCQAEAGLKVIGQADNGHQAVIVACQLQPEVMLLDFHLPLLGGVATTQAIMTNRPTTHVILLTTAWRTVEQQQAIQAGAKGYLTKDAPPTTFIRVIYTISQGQTWFYTPTD